MQAAAAAAPGLLRQTRVALRLRHIAPAPVVGLFYLFCLCAGVGARRAIGRHCEYRQSPSVGAHAQQRSLFFCVAARRAELQHVRRAGVLQTACDRAQPRRIDGLRVAAVPARPLQHAMLQNGTPGCSNARCCNSAHPIARAQTSAHTRRTRAWTSSARHTARMPMRVSATARVPIVRARTTVHSTARSCPTAAPLRWRRRCCAAALCSAIRPQVLFRTQRLSPLCLWPEGSAGQRRSESPPLAPRRPN